MAAMCPQQAYLAGLPGRAPAQPGGSRAARGANTQKAKMSERRRSEPSVVIDKTLQKHPRVEETPTAYLDPFNYLPPTGTSRTLVMDSRAELKRGLQKWDRHLFLYTDLFIVTKAKIKNHNILKIKYKVKLTDMWISSCIEGVGEGNLDTMKSFVLGWPIVNFVATFSSPEQKETWYTLLQRYVNIEKEKDFPKDIPVKVYTQDIDNCAQVKTITIKNSETAIEVINTSLAELGLTGSERDYRLWIRTGKQVTPYPLVGHEHPYCIHVSHLRNRMGAVALKKDMGSSLLQQSLLTEPRPQEMGCQFILKPSHKARTRSGHKIFRRRRSMINWAFWKSPNAQLDNELDPASPTSPLTGKLFGISLPNICENDNLPTPIMNMLWLLYERGPLTKGIFRQSANVRACKELKEKLNSGAEVQIDCESLFVVASVFKEFLRSIPGSIFSSNLFDHWVTIMDEVDHEERIHTIQLLLDQLPRANLIFLKYLFGVLHCIEQNSSLNNMNAFNLAICIAPSVLWPPTTSTPEVENEFAKKVSHLIQFLIENCYEIFGEEIISLFGEASKRYESKENIPVDSCYRLNDSYDSLENDLEDFRPYVTPSSDIPKLRMGSRSLDSVLTSSDHDMDTATSLATLSDLSLTYSRDDIKVDPPVGDRAEGSVMFPILPLGSHPKLPLGTDIPTFIAESVTGVSRQRHSSEPTLDTEISVEECGPQESPMGAADAELSTNVHLARTPSGRNLIRSGCSGLSLCSKSSYEILQTAFKDVQETQPSELATPDAPSPLRWQRRCSEPTPQSRSTKLYSLKEFYQKKFRKNSCDTVLSQTDGNCFKQNPPLEVEKPYSESSLLSLRAPRRNINVSIKKASPTKQFKFFSKSCTVKSCDSITTIGQVGNEFLAPDISQLPRGIAQRNRRLSEPNAEGQFFKTADATKPLRPSIQPLDEDCLKWHKKLQQEGQKLMRKSFVMGKGPGNLDDISVLSELKSFPPRACSASLSSLDTSLSGSFHSQDSMFSKVSESAVFPTDETTCPGEPGARPDSEIRSTSPGQVRTYPAQTFKDTSGWQAHLHSVTLHPSTWLRSGLASLKNWSLNKKTKTIRAEEKSTQRGAMDHPPPTLSSSRPSTSQEVLETHYGMEANVPEPCRKTPQEGGDSVLVPQEISTFCSRTASTLTKDNVPSLNMVPTKACDSGDEILAKDI